MEVEEGGRGVQGGGPRGRGRVTASGDGVVEGVAARIYGVVRGWGSSQKGFTARFGPEGFGSLLNGFCGFIGLGESWGWGCGSSGVWRRLGGGGRLQS